MRIIKRVFAIIIVVLAIIGLLSAIGAIAGTWIVNNKITEVTVNVLTAVETVAIRATDKIDNVDLRLGRLEQLPIEDRTLDAAMVVMVLHHLADPSEVLAEASRALKSRAKILVVDLLPHEREEFRQQMGHIWLGFGEREIRSRLTAAGFDNIHFRELRAAPEVMGPALFAATARVAEARATRH